MSDLEQRLEAWQAAGLIDQTTAQRLRAYEAVAGHPRRLRWPALLALALGGLTLSAGILLFIAAHWDTISPGTRFGLVLLLVGGFHLAGGGVGTRFPALTTTLHALGTASLGAGIYLAGQIFNLQEHWPAALLMWLIGAAVGWALLRDWPQAALAGLLGPAWLAGEWEVATGLRTERAAVVLAAGLLAFALTYLGAATREHAGAWRRALAWIGGLAVIPSAIGLALVSTELTHEGARIPDRLWWTGWSVALAVPLGIGILLRGRDPRPGLLITLWVLAGAALPPDPAFLVYVWGAVGALGLMGWGVLEAVPGRINLGVAGFAVCLLTFYFSSVMDRLGRSLSLIGLGVLLLAGGWLLERVRRRLVARATAGAP